MDNWDQKDIKINRYEKVDRYDQLVFKKLYKNLSVDDQSQKGIKINRYDRLGLGGYKDFSFNTYKI